ncbi:MAG: MoaD/ThiS family protein [Desulfobacterales bacterium]|nr:MoaD/ThiS family protein [Desulfobacterales bacterium]
MRINVKANFRIEGIDKDHVEMKGRPTLGEVLIDLAGRSEFLFVLPDGKIDPEVEVLLNGLEYPFLPKRLDTELKDGDEVEIMLMALGGG